MMKGIVSVIALVTSFLIVNPLILAADENLRQVRNEENMPRQKQVWIIDNWF